MEKADVTPPIREALAEAFQLSSDILENIELNNVALENIALKAARLARLLNEFDTQKIMAYEASGYPHFPDGVPPDIWQLGLQAGRVFSRENPATKQNEQVMYLESIGQLEQSLKTVDTALAAARDPDISVSSANPTQYVSAGIVNRNERASIRYEATSTAQKLASRRKLIYEYALRTHYELKFSGIADDIFTRVRSNVDQRIGKLVPDAVQKFAAVYANLQTQNPENWANAVHSCRRILQDLADALYPATDQDRIIERDGKKITVKMGKDSYTNRIIAFVEAQASSDRFREIVGSNLSYLGDRLDSAFEASQKGSHATIASKEEADRYVVYTYLLVGDVLSLTDEQ